MKRKCLSQLFIKPEIVVKHVISFVLSVIICLSSLPVSVCSAETLRPSNARTGEGLHFPVATTADYIGTYSALDGDNISNANSAYTAYGTNIYSYHHGTEYYALDISGTGANAGAVVYAVADGIVVDWREGYGQITLKHGGLTLLDGTTYYSTWYSTYVHMKVADVKTYLGNNPIGKKVDCGDPIGTVWYTGSSAYHLHFSMTTEINPITGGSFHYRDRRNNAPNDANTILRYARKTLNPKWVFEIMNSKQINVDWGVADNGQADLKARFQRGTEYAPGNVKNSTLFGGSASGNTTPSANMTPSEYLALSNVTYTNMSVKARPKNGGSLQVWKLPWTDTKNGVQNASLKLTTVSGTFQITKKVVNHAGNIWYECKIGSSTVGYVYSNEIILLPYGANYYVAANSITTDTAKLYVTWMNPGNITVAKAGFRLKDSSGNVLKSVIENVASGWQTKSEIPGSHEMKTEYNYPLQPNTTYYYELFCADSSGKPYDTVTGSFKTKPLLVTGLSVSPATVSLNIGKSQQLTASVTPSNASNKNVTWKSSNTAVATVSASGVVTAKAIGTTTITATAADGSGKTASAKITVSCNHSSGTVTLPAVAPTCTATGLTAGKKCSACGAVTQAQTVVAAKGHTEITDKAVAATCTKDGKTEGKYCSVCGTVTKAQETVKAAGHKEVTDKAVAATCTTDGKTEGKHCSVCGTVTKAQETVKAAGHKEVTDQAVAATCTTDGKTEGKHCSVCGTVTKAQKVVKATGHSFADGKCSTCGTEDPDYVEPTKPTEPEVKGVTRVAGADRYATAFKAADTLKAELGVSKFQNIIVACGTNFPDALTGTYLAAQKNAPILLVKSNNVSQVNEYIQKNLASGGTLYLLGDNGVVPDSVGKGISGITIKRLGGATRYDTNLLILQEAGVGDKDIIVCTGQNFADSLSASASGLPILLVKGGLTDSQKAFLASGSGKKIIVGGTAAVSASVESQLKAYGEVKRLAGDTRYDTSVLVAKEFFDAPTIAVLAYAQNFPDGLSGGPLAYALNAPLILTDNNKSTAAVDYATGLGIKSGYVLGGTGLISDRVVKNIFSMGADEIILAK